MSFEEDFSSQYLSILILRLKCSQQCKYLCRKPFGCLQQHLLMNACYCRSLLYTKYRLPFFKMQRYAENKLPKHSVIMCSWHSAVFIHGLHFIGSRALEEHHEHVCRKPQKLWGPSPASCTIAREPKAVGPDAGAASPCLLQEARAQPEFVPQSAWIELKMHRHAHNPNSVLRKLLLSKDFWYLNWVFSRSVT